MPAAAAAARAGVELVQSAEGAARCRRLGERVAQIKEGLRRAGWPVPAGQSAIIPLVVDEESCAVALAERLLERGIFVPAIRYPTVARGSARLRITLTASHTTSDISELTKALATLAIRPQTLD